MAGLLEEYIQSEISKPFAWGETDCASTADRWVKLNTGFSPLQTFGRVHKDEREAKEWLESEGIAVAVNRVMRSCGFSKTKTPKKGDIGIIVYNNLLCIAIKTETFWFTRNENGIIGAPLNSVWKSWTI